MPRGKAPLELDCVDVCQGIHFRHGTRTYSLSRIPWFCRMGHTVHGEVCDGKPCNDRGRSCDHQAHDSEGKGTTRES
jgi:hypothetical protein